MSQVVHVFNSMMTIVWLGMMDDPGKQDFPEWEAMQRFEALREKKIAEGCAVK